MNTDPRDTDGDKTEPLRDLYLEQLEEKAGPRRWPGLGPVWSSIRMLAGLGRLRLVGIVGVQVVVAALGALQVLLIKNVLVAIDGGNVGILGRVLPSLVALIAINTAVGAVAVVQAQTQVVLGEIVVRATWERLLSVASVTPLLAYERSTFYDRLQRIIGNTLSKPLLVVQGAISLAAGLFGVIGLMVVILLVSPILVPIFLLAGGPLYLIARMGSRIEFEFALAQTQNQRRRFSLADLLTQRASAAEVRAFGLAGLVRRRYASLYDDYLVALRNKSRRRTRLALASGAATFVIAAAAATVLLYLVDIGNVSVAAAGAAAVAMVLLAGRIEQTFSGIARVMDSALFIAELDDFAAATGADAGTVDGPMRAALPLDFNAIELADISFCYPGSDRPAISRINATIPRGRIIALVGENGSGKTTLSKILAGLYPPTSGSVLWDGKSVDTLDPERVARSVAIVFQDFVRYEMSLAENVGVGSADRIEDSSGIHAAAYLAGLTPIVQALSRGFETFMSTRFPGGADLSVGQWQRVAVARALFRNAPLIIMDEPTAALDAKGEAALFDVIRRLGEGRTVILVTHRFATTRSADQILVMDCGRIIERGDHEELMTLAGRYAEMFKLQSAPFVGSAGRRRPRPRYPTGSPEYSGDH